MRLGVNIDHVATLRQARRGHFPDPIEAGLVCQHAGANSIVCHLREDRRHMQDQDVAALRRRLSVPLNLEMSSAESIVRTALQLKPHQVTLVPERRQELTTEGGLNVVRQEAQLRRVIKRFHQRRIAVSLFIDPRRAQIEAAARTGARIIELHTGRYANAATGTQRLKELTTLASGTVHAARLGLSVAAGHGLDYANVKAVAAIPGIEELNIGFSIIAQAVFIGLDQAVRRMKRLL